MKVICMTTSKGGAAKTTNTVEIAAALKILGKKVLVIDIDQTTGLTKYVGAYYDPKERKDLGLNTIYDVLTGNVSVDDAIIDVECFDLIAGDERLANPQITFNKEDDQYLLKDVCDMLQENGYDYIFIDHGPQKDLLQKMSYIASDVFFITTLLAENDRQQAKNAIEEIKQLQNSRNKLVTGDIYGFIVSRVKKVSLSDIAIADMQEEAENYKNVRNVETRIFTVPDAIAIAEAQTYKMPNTITHKSSNVSRAYYNIANYIIETIK